MKYVSPIAAIVAVLVLAGSLAVPALNSESCIEPRTKMASEIDASIAVMERYIAENVAQDFRNPALVDWSAERNPQIGPAVIAVYVRVGEGPDPLFGVFSGPSRLYFVSMSRDCVGDEWEVDVFKLAKGEQPPPNASVNGRPAAVS